MIAWEDLPTPLPAAALESLMLGADPVESRYLLVDLREMAEDPAAAAWLRRRPCPVLAIAEPGTAGELAAACDVVASVPGELASVITHIEHAPLAAAILVQTLRVTEMLAPADALVVESLAFATLQAGPEFARWHSGRTPPAHPPPENGPAALLARDGDTLSVTLNRPRNRNAMSIEMRDALAEAFTLAGMDRAIGSLVVDGAGDCFSVGGDLAEFGHASSAPLSHMIRMQRLPARTLLPVATHAEFRLHGACIGAGIELPAFAARIHARPDAFFQLPEIKFGLIPGAGGCVSIPRRIGRQRMAQFALSARRISARTALAWGLIDMIVE